MSKGINPIGANPKEILKMSIQTKFIEEQINGLLDEARDAIIEFKLASLRGHHATGWHALCVYPNGSIATIHEASQCTPESEYFSRSPHPLTFISKQGDSFFPDPSPGWGWVEDEKGNRIAPFDEKFGFNGGSDVYESVADLGHDEFAKKLALGWRPFSLNLQDWNGDMPEADEEIIETVREWAAAGNFEPAV